MRGSQAVSARKRRRTPESEHSKIAWDVLPKLVAYLILRHLIRQTTPDYIRCVRFVCVQWSRAFRSWWLWHPIFNEIALARQKLIPNQYVIRPSALRCLDFVSLWQTKLPLPKDAEFYTGYGCIASDVGLYEGQLVANRKHGPGVLYNTTFRYIGQFKMNQFHDKHCRRFVVGTSKLQKNEHNHESHADGTSYTTDAETKETEKGVLKLAAAHHRPRITFLERKLI